MKERPTHSWGRSARRLVAGSVLTVAALAGMTGSANAAVVSTFSGGTLTVFGDSLDNNVTVSRDAAGKILVNGGAVGVSGGKPTVANTALIQVFGQGGHDTITLSETNGALPRANLFGGAGNDTVTGGSGGDLLFGQSGNDALLGKGGFDFLFGGSENDTLTGGDADDQVFGESGNDRAVWNPGDDTDLNEGGGNTDTTEVNGGNGAEQFTTTANGTRVRFDRLNPAPFAIDIGTSEHLVVNANGGDDSYSATGNLAALIRVTVDGGANDDTLIGTNGADLLLGGDGADFADGQQGSDVALLGAADDTFGWDPGDGSDVVEGQAGRDKLAFNGSGASETIGASANGSRVLFTRNIGSVVMDLNDVEDIEAKVLSGADNLTVGDLSGTDVTDVEGNLGGNDAADDNVIANGTNGDDVALVGGSAGSAQVSGLAAQTAVSGATGNDRLTIHALAGDDVIDASGVPAGSVLLTLDGGADDDVLVGGSGNDALLGRDGDDVLIGGLGQDVIDGGAGDNIGIQSVQADSPRRVAAEGEEWLDAHARVVDGKTVVSAAGERWTLPRAGLAQLKRDAR